jgi:hypothetical protein
MLTSPPAQNECRYSSGWWLSTNDQTGEVKAEAWFAPESRDWYDIYPARTWWDALAKALALAAAHDDCEFSGGPGDA